MTESEDRCITRVDWLLVGCLMLLVLPLRGWLLANTEVTARDSIGFIRYALRFEREPWKQVCETSDQHPGFPMLVWLMSQPVRAIQGETTPENMQLTTQLISFCASLLLVFPMYFLGRQFFDRKVSFAATLLYQYLPVSAQHLSDGISEPAYLVLLVSALLQAVHAVRDRSIWRCALCGLFVGASYLLRPEGLLILPVFVLVLIVRQSRADWRCGWGRFFACGAAMGVAVGLTGSIYVYATGNISKKPSIQQTLRNLKNLIVQAEPAPAGALFAHTFSKTDDKTLLVYRSAKACVAEVTQGLHYIGIIPAIMGFVWSFSSLRRQPGFWMLLGYGLLHTFILISLAMSVYYVSDRHVMILVLGGTYFTVVGLRELTTRVLSGSTQVAWWRSAPVWSVILFVAFLGFCLPRATQRLHGNRVGNHVAGLWLAEHVAKERGDIILDDHAWSHFFSGMLFEESRDPAVPADHQPMCYVVTTRSRDPLVDATRQQIAQQAKVVYTWPESIDVEKARVVVYQQPRNFETNPWRKGADSRSECSTLRKAGS